MLHERENFKTYKNTCSPVKKKQGKSVTWLCITVTEMYFYALKYGLLISASIC